MRLEETDIRSFSELWEEEFGEKLSPDEARHHASRLLELYGLIYQPTPDEQGLTHPDSSTQHS